MLFTLHAAVSRLAGRGAPLLVLVRVGALFAVVSLVDVVIIVVCVRLGPFGALCDPLRPHYGLSHPDRSVKSLLTEYLRVHAARLLLVRLKTIDFIDVVLMRVEILCLHFLI